MKLVEGNGINERFLNGFFEGIAKEVTIRAVAGLLLAFFPAYVVVKYVSLRFNWWVHYPIGFSLACGIAAVGGFVGGLLGLIRVRTVFAKAPLRQECYAVGIGAFYALGVVFFLVAIAPEIRKTKKFVERLRTVSTYQVESITAVREEHPEPDVQVTISEPALINSFLEMLALAEPYSPSHDSPKVRGHLTLDFKDKGSLDLYWYYGTKNYREGAVLDGDACVPGLHRVLLSMFKAPAKEPPPGQK